MIRHGGRALALAVALGALAPLPAAAQDWGWKTPFDGKTLDGWKAAGGAWKAEEGALVGTSDGAVAACVAQESFSDFEVYLDFKVDPSAEAALLLRAGEDGTGAGEVLLGNREGIPVGAVAVDGKRVAVPEKEAQQGFRPDDWNRLYVRIAGKPGKITVVLNQWRILNEADAPGFPAADGRIGLRVQGGQGKSVRLRDLRVRPVGQDPPLTGDVPDNKADVARLMAKVFYVVGPGDQPSSYSPDAPVVQVGSRIRFDCTPKDTERKHTQAKGRPTWTFSDLTLVSVGGPSPYNPLLKALKPGTLTVCAEVDGIRSKPFDIKLVE